MGNQGMGGGEEMMMGVGWRLGVVALEDEKGWVEQKAEVVEGGGERSTARPGGGQVRPP